MAVRSAVASVPARLLLARLRSTPAVAAATCWRRTLSSGNENADGQRKSEETEEARNKRELEERRSKYQAEEARRRLKDEVTQDVLKALTSHDALDMQKLVDSVLNKNAFDLDKMLSNHKVHIDIKVREMKQASGNVLREMRVLADDLHENCCEKARVAETRITVLNQKHDEFKDLMFAEIRHSQYGIAVGAGVLLVGFAVGVALAYQAYKFG